MSVRKIIPKKKGSSNRTTAVKVAAKKPAKKAQKKATPKALKKISYVGLVTDNSGSMEIIKMAAGRDFNENVKSIKEGAEQTGIDTFVSLVQCGLGPNGITRAFTLCPISSLGPIPPEHYRAEGGTPLFDKLRPGDHGNYDVYMQSTSFNRKLVPGTTVLYWRAVAR